MRKTGKKIKELFDSKKENYIISNGYYAAGAILLLLALILFSDYHSIEFIILKVFLISILSLIYLHNKLKAIILILFIIFLLGKEMLLVAAIITYIYIKLIPNVKPLGQEVFEYVKGFEIT